MATADDLRHMALALEGTIEAPHFDRAAFKVRRNYVTLAADGESANFMLSREEQEFKCMLLPDTLRPVPNKWGENGATTAKLADLNTGDLQDLLDMAHAHAVSKKPTR